MTPSVEPLEKLFSYFEHSSARTFDCPMPLSPEFWNAYGEPVHFFLTAARRLFWAVSTIAELGKELRDKTLKNDRAMLLETAVRKLNALAAPVCVSISPSDDGSMTQTWSASSLLSSLSLMALIDLTRGLVRSCENCRKIFVTEAPQGIYCSGRCRDTSLKRALRERQKKAVELHRAGQSIKTIATKVRSDEGIVKGWLKNSLKPKSIAKMKHPRR
jgi:hypothetical protein